jgi:TctA family transporter
MEVAAAEDALEESGVAVYLPRLLAGVISGALTGLFALGTHQNTRPFFPPLLELFM